LPTRSSDLRYNREVTLEEAYAGKQATIGVPTLAACQTCEGSGAAPGHHLARRDSGVRLRSPLAAAKERPSCRMPRPGRRLQQRPPYRGDVMASFAGPRGRLDY
jgi:hypothetical protein